MAVRSRFRRPQERLFCVNLTVHQLDSIPVIHRQLYVYWRARRAQPSEGRTPAQPVEAGNVVRWNISNEFSIVIPSEPGDPTLLQPAPFELQIRSERQTRWIATTTYQKEGRVELDLSEMAAAGVLSRNYLVQDSLLNMTLRLTIRVTHQAGDKIFRTRTASYSSSMSVTPSVSRSSATFTSVDGVPMTVSHDESVLSSDTPGHFPKDVMRSVTDSAERLKVSLDVSNGSVPDVGKKDNAAGTPAPTIKTSSTSFLKLWDNDASSNFCSEMALQSTSCVLEKSVPNPEVVQRPVYERIFQRRMRDTWPDYVTGSRVDAEKVVNEVFATVCAADGIVVAPTKEPVRPVDDCGNISRIDLLGRSDSV